jgi:hypothetical protein
MKLISSFLPAQSPPPIPMIKALNSRKNPASVLSKFLRSIAIGVFGDSGVWLYGYLHYWARLFFLKREDMAELMFIVESYIIYYRIG